jgi:hypothetical protein
MEDAKQNLFTRDSFITMCCDRCGQVTGSFKMSWFNTDIICSICDIAENLHPDIDKARKADTEAVKQGEYNFPGIGKPADL